ncbi:hypothetical protein [Actinocrispum sp. NPDC049592]|uniref:hypothetical protein n=1 Tax=Actinocrispum sp. NPDC049592 TaxID=3154835 RepID=UPI00341D9D06
MIAVISGITGNCSGSSKSRSMYAQVSNTPDSGRSATTTIPRIVVTDAVFRAEELVSFLPHHLVIDPWQPSMTLYELVGRQPSSAGNSALVTVLRWSRRRDQVTTGVRRPNP